MSIEDNDRAHFPEARPQKAAVVVGMHRSGTSALTLLLGRLGMAMPLDPLPPHPDNPKGYWESQAVMTLNDGVFGRLASSWFDTGPIDAGALSALAASERDGVIRVIGDSFPSGADFVLKDPRLCRLAPIWFSALESLKVDLRVILALRDPVEVAQSLQKRDGMDLEYGLALWFRNATEAEIHSRGHPRMAVTFETLLTQPQQAAGRLAAFIGKGHAADINDVVDPALRRQRGEESPHAFAQACRGLYEALAGLSELDDPAARNAIDALSESIWREHLCDGRIVNRELLAQWRRADDARRALAKAERRIKKLRAALKEAGVPSRTVIQNVRESGLFDEAWYLATYPEAAASALEPVVYYLLHGAAAGHDPSPGFKSALYARQMLEG